MHSWWIWSTFKQSHDPILLWLYVGNLKAIYVVNWHMTLQMYAWTMLLLEQGLHIVLSIARQRDLSLYIPRLYGAVRFDGSAPAAFNSWQLADVCLKKFNCVSHQCIRCMGDTSCMCTIWTVSCFKHSHYSLASHSLLSPTCTVLEEWTKNWKISWQIGTSTGTNFLWSRTAVH